MISESAVEASATRTLTHSAERTDESRNASENHRPVKPPHESSV